MKNINCAQKTRIVVALLSAIFIISMVSPALLANAYTWPSTPTASWIAQDTTTGGDWRNGPYGSYAYILPNPPVNDQEVPIGCFSVPCKGYSALINPPYSWASWQISGITWLRHNSPYWDEYYSQTPRVTYYVEGTRTNTVQYPVFEWAWNSFESSQTDHREVYYPIGNATSGNHWRLAAWDDGGERGTPTHGYMNFILTFPKGTYKLTVYAYDYEGTSRVSETFRIYYGTTLLASKQISNNLPSTGSNTFHNGVYETFKITVSSTSASIILQVYNDIGYNTVAPSNNNVLLSGIFVDKMP